MALERLPDRADRRRQHAAEVGVVLGEAEPVAAGRRRGPDRQALALGEGDAELPGAAGVDVGAGDEDRVGRRVEGGGEGAHRLRVGRGAAADPAVDRRLGVARVDLDPPVVHRQRDEDGAARRQAGEVGAVGEGQRHVLGPRRLVATT